MNVYDFDNTIYDGESVFDFFVFCMKKKPRLIASLPPMVINLIKYKLCRITEKELIDGAEVYLSKFANMFDDIDGLIKEFWDKNIKKIKPFYLEAKRDDDIIISASWDKLIGEALLRIGVKNYVASSISSDMRHIECLCYGKRKTEIFDSLYKGIELENFYTDSMNDLPMIEKAKNAYLIKGHKIVKIKEGS